MRCPKCSHEQDSVIECEACGLLFRKFDQVREQKQEQAAVQKETDRTGGGALTRLVSVLVLVAATAGLTYYFAASKPAAQSPPAQTPTASTTPSDKQTPTQASVGPQPQQTEQPRAMHAGSAIELAKNGTVSIEAPWGKGSGFFLTETAVITNKHVVEPDRKQLDEMRQKIQTRRKLIDLEEEKLADARRQVARMPDGPARRQLVILIQEREKDLAKILPEQQEAEASLNKLTQPRSHTDIKIFLADGSEFSAQSVQPSPRRDLALVTVYADKQTVLRAASQNSGLKQGDRVYAIGNPVGLRNTVTSGIFSGYRQQTETKELFLQTDAAINPGNSGGPLIDERGQVLGVNTMILQNTEGIGFAIPIEAVFEEFSISREQGR